MLELPLGLWNWLNENARDLARIAVALERMVEELARIRAAMEDDDRQEDQ